MLIANGEKGHIKDSSRAFNLTSSCVTIYFIPQRFILKIRKSKWRGSDSLFTSSFKTLLLQKSGYVIMCNRKGCGLLWDEEESEEEEELWTSKRARCQCREHLKSPSQVWIISQIENLDFWFCEDALKRKGGKRWKWRRLVKQGVPGMACFFFLLRFVDSTDYKEKKAWILKSLNASDLCEIVLMSN